MQTQKTLQASEESSSTSPIFVEAEKLIEQTQKLTQMIAGRAYEFFEGRGRQIGHELEDWFRAEAEVLRPVPIEMKEDENRLTVCAELPGFTGTEIKISAEPQRLIIKGSNDELSEQESGKVVFNERRSKQFFRSLTLPAEIDPANVTAALKDGLLEIALPKLLKRQAAAIEVKAA
jgi:HSP20 family protein